MIEYLGVVKVRGDCLIRTNLVEVVTAIRAQHQHVNQRSFSNKLLQSTINTSSQSCISPSTFIGDLVFEPRTYIPIINPLVRRPCGATNPTTSSDNSPISNHAVEARPLPNSSLLSLHNVGAIEPCNASHEAICATIGHSPPTERKYTSDHLESVWRNNISWLTYPRRYWTWYRRI